MWDEGEIRRIAQRQHGLIDRAGAIWAGATDHYIQSQIESLRWTQPHPGVYYLNATAMSWKASVLAAVLGGGDMALASHRTAGVLWGLEGFRSRTIEVTVPYGDGPIPEGVIVHRTRRVLPGGSADSIPCTSIERTILDLAAILPDAVVEKALASAIRKRLTDVARMDRIVADQAGRGVKGTRRIRRVLASVDEDRTGSVGEVEVLQLIREAPVPNPIVQHRIRLPNGSNAYPDFCWPDRMKLVEVDGFEAHGSPEQLHDDLIRQNTLMELGWQIRRFSVRQIRNQPEVVQAEITRFIDH